MTTIYLQDTQHAFKCMTTMYLHDTQHAFKYMTTFFANIVLTGTIKGTKVVYTSENEVTKRHRSGEGTGKGG